MLLFHLQPDNAENPQKKYGTQQYSAPQILQMSHDILGIKTGSSYSRAFQLVSLSPEWGFQLTSSTTGATGVSELPQRNPTRLRRRQCQDHTRPPVRTTRYCLFRTWYSSQLSVDWSVPVQQQKKPTSLVSSLVCSLKDHSVHCHIVPVDHSCLDFCKLLCVPPGRKSKNPCFAAENVVVVGGNHSNLR